MATRPKRRAGRPKKEIVLTPEQLIEDMAKIGCTAEEIATVTGIARSTVYERFSDALEKGRAAGKESLRRAQFKTAIGGNAVMQIWLGKQYLGQTDKLPDFSKLTDEELLRLVSGSKTGGAGASDSETGETGTRSTAN